MTTGEGAVPVRPLALAEIIDVPAVQALMDDFYTLTDLPIAVIDLEGRVLVGTGWQDICTKFHRINPETLANCLESDRVLTQGVARGEFRAYKCKNGLSDTVTPLFVGDTHVANVFTGQFFYDDEEPDIAFFEQQAARYGFDRDGYLDAIRRVPRVSHATVDALMRFYIRLAEQIAQVGYSNRMLSQTVEDLANTESKLQESSQLNQQVIDGAREGIIVYGTDMRYKVFNPFMETLSGVMASEVLGKLPGEAFPFLMSAGVIENYERVFAGETTPAAELSFEIDGRTGWVIETSAPLRDASGEVIGVIATVQDITERKEAGAALLASNERLEGVLQSITETMGKIVETRDPYTQGHEQGVARLSRLISAEMGLPADDVDAIELAALVHDIGKLSVPAEILNKPGKLSDIEFSLIKEHSQSGYDLLKDIDYDWPIAEIVLQHHERMDGSGYPNALYAEDISMAARVIAVADVVEAMTSHRPYRPALGLDAAIAEISSHPGKYDADVSAACMRLHEQGRILL